MHLLATKVVSFTLNLTSLVSILHTATATGSENLLLIFAPTDGIFGAIITMHFLPMGFYKPM